MVRFLTRRAKRQKERQRRHILAVYILLTLQYENRDFWVHPINKDRHLKGEFFTLYKDLREYPDKFFRWYRMSIEQFDYILEKLRPVLQKDNNNYRDSISPEERLAITLR